MQHRVLGKTNALVSAVGLGGIPMQRTSEQDAVRSILNVFSKGVTFVDTARAYSVSEAYIGMALKLTDRNRIFLATKAPALSYTAMKVEVATSLKQLQVDYIDLYQVHNIRKNDSVDIVFGAGGAYEYLLEAKQGNLIKHIGITSHSADVLVYAINKFGHLIDTIMYPFNIVESQGIEMFRLAKSKNIATIAMKPLAGGNIDDANLAMRYVLTQEFIDIAIPGMSSEKEVDEDIISDFSPLSPIEIEKCNQIRASLGDNFCRRCGYCLPCPQEIDIPTMFTLHNYVAKYDLREWATPRYLANAKRAKDCISCGRCEVKCPYGLQIRQKLKTVSADFNDNN